MSDPFIDTPYEPVDEDTLVNLGYNAWVAEGLAGRELTYNRLQHSSVDELFDEVLSWHGILGFSGSIRDALDNLRNQEAV